MHLLILMETRNEPMYYLLLTKQIILATMDCQSENKDCELFWKTWNDALADLQAGLTFGRLLDELGCNWNALKEVYGEDL